MTIEEELRLNAFRSDLRDLINRHSRENGSNTPDYILADYLVECLLRFDEFVNRRASWYGHFDAPGSAAAEMAKEKP